MRYVGFKIAYKLWRVTIKDFFGSRYITNTKPMRELFSKVNGLNPGVSVVCVV